MSGPDVYAIVDKYGREVFTFLDNFLRVMIQFNYKLDEYIEPPVNLDGTNDTKNDAKADTGS